MKKNKKTISFFVVVVLAVSLFSTSFASYEEKVSLISGETNFKSGSGETHEYIVRKSVEILKNDKNDSIYKKIKSYESTLFTYSAWPDTYERDNLSAGHFYDPDSGKNFLGRTSPTALTKFIEHTNDAITNYKTNEAEAFKSLGKAIHYLEDIHVPHHAANKIAFFTNHTEYENWVKDNQNDFLSTSTNKYTYLDDEVHTNFENYSRTIFIDAAHMSKNNIDNAISSSENKMRIAANNTVAHAQETVGAYLYNFILSQQ